jgi:hypothetical protein
MSDSDSDSSIELHASQKKKKKEKNGAKSKKKEKQGSESISDDGDNDTSLDLMQALKIESDDDSASSSSSDEELRKKEEKIKELEKELKLEKKLNKERKKEKSKKKLVMVEVSDSSSDERKVTVAAKKKKIKEDDADSESAEDEDDRKTKKKKDKKKKEEKKLLLKLNQSVPRMSASVLKRNMSISKQNSYSNLFRGNEEKPSPVPLPIVEEAVKMKKKGRYTVIDPTQKMKVARPIDCPVLPVFDEPPDWMFNAATKEESKGVFNVRGGTIDLEQDVKLGKKKKGKGKDEFDEVGADSQAYAKKFMNDLRKSKKVNSSKGLSVSFSSTLESGVTFERAESLYKCLNKDPTKKDSGYSDDNFMDLIIENPDGCTIKYAFDAFRDDRIRAKMYPLSMLCALGASITAIRECYEAHKIALHEKDVWIGTPLHYACIYGASLDVIKFLVGINDNLLVEIDERGKLTPLHMAIISEAKPEVVSFLVEASSASLQMVDMNGMMPLHLACESDTAIDVVKDMIGGYHLACVARSSDGSTPLHIAVGRKAHLSLLKALIKGHAAALKVEDNRGRIPLHIAVAVQADYKTVRLLVKYCQDGIRVKNNLNQTPLQTAEKRNVEFDERVLELLRPYIDPNDSDQ